MARRAFVRRSLLVFALTATTASSAARAEDGVADARPRIADYEIEATLDPATRIVTGSALLTWRNRGTAPASELCFHLYWNAWRNDHSTWMREARLSGRLRGREIRESDWSWMEVESMRLEDGAELERRFADPDDGNAADRTVLIAGLPAPVAPGETLRVRYDWRARFPHTFARTGARGDYFLAAHWFPKLAVYEPAGWNCHTFHVSTEFYSDYGDYDVSLTLPERFVIGATGRRAERRANGDGTVTHRFTERGVHAFSWVASPDFLVREQRFEVAGLPPVDMRLLIQPEHRGQAERHFHATAAALEHYGKWYGPYPYGHLTVVDPAWGSRTGGMEYPTLFTSGTRLFNPFGGGSPEGVTIHEAGHQFWYGVVGNNEFEHAWIDEGLNTFSEARVSDVVYGEEIWRERYFSPPGTRFGGFLPVLYGDLRMSRAVYGNRLPRYLASGATTGDPQSTPSYRYFYPLASSLSYNKTALWLATLENHLGWPTLRSILSTFFERYRYDHPRPEDFFAVADEVSGRDLGWFFDQVHRSSAIFDYAIDSVASLPAAVEGWVEEDGRMVFKDGGMEEGAEPRFRTEVAVRRHGDGVFPVDVLLVYEDGSEERVAWDGRARWTLITREGPSKLRHAAVDPERELLLDVDFTNNSRLRAPRPGLATGKWAARWMIWLQDLMATWTFFL